MDINLETVASTKVREEVKHLKFDGGLMVMVHGIGAATLPLNFVSRSIVTLLQLLFLFVHFYYFSFSS